MEMDLVEIAELTGVDTFKCLDFGDGCTGPSEGLVRTGTPRARLTPQRHPTHSVREAASSVGRRSNIKERK